MYDQINKDCVFDYCETFKIKIFYEFHSALSTVKHNINQYHENVIAHDQNTITLKPYTNPPTHYATPLGMSLSSEYCCQCSRPHEDPHRE